MYNNRYIPNPERSFNGINWKDPITKGLEFLLPMFGGAGSFPVELVNRWGKWTTTNTTAHIFSPFGGACSFTTAADNYLGNSDFICPTKNVTIVYIVQPNDTNDQYVAFNVNDQINDLAYRCLSHFPYTGVVYFDFGAASGDNRVNYTPDAGFFGMWHHMVFTAGQHGMSIHEDGALKASKTVSITRTQNTAGFVIGKGPAGQCNNNYVAQFGFWSRVLQPQEIIRLYIEPWCMLRPVRRYFTPPATVGGVVNNATMDAMARVSLTGGLR